MGCHEKFCYIRTCDSRKYYYGVVIRKLLYTHTHTFNGPLSGTRTTRVSRYQKGKTNLDFSEARDSEWQ